MSHRASVVYTDKAYEYLVKAAAEEDCTMSEIIHNALKLHKKMRDGEFYTVQGGEFRKVTIL